MKYIIFISRKYDSHQYTDKLLMSVFVYGDQPQQQQQQPLFPSTRKIQYMGKMRNT